MRKQVQFDDSSDDDENLSAELAQAAERERKKNPHALQGKANPPKDLSSLSDVTYAEKITKKSLFSSSSDDDSDDERIGRKSAQTKDGASTGKKDKDGESRLPINRAYAEKYEFVKRQKELHSLTSKYGKRMQLDESSEEDEEDEEDDEAVLLTREKELAFAKALYAVRHPEKAELQKEKSFFPPPEEQLEYNTKVFEEAVEKKKKKRKGHTLADEYQRAVMASAEGKLPEDLGTVENTSGSKRLAPRTEKEKALRDAFLKSAEEIDDFSAVPKAALEPSEDDGGVQKKKRAVGSSTTEEEEEEARRLIAEALDDEGVNEDEIFIKNFFANELWRTDDNENENEIDYKALAEAEQQEMFYDDAEVWEHKYQENKYRHEEGIEEASHVQTFPRPIGEAAEGLLRKQDTSRKDARQRRMERIAAAKQREVEELKRLKHLKRQEIENQRALIASVSGLSKKRAGGDGGMDDMSDEDEALARLKEVWSEKDFDAPFDPVEFDKKMAKIFNEEYYNEENVDENEIQYMEEELDNLDDDEKDFGDGKADSKAKLKEVIEEPELFHTESLEEAKKMVSQTMRKNKKTQPKVDSEDPFAAAFLEDAALGGTSSTGLGSDTLALLYPSASIQQLENASFQKRQELEGLLGDNNEKNKSGPSNEEVLEKLKRELKEKEEAYLNLHHEVGSSMPFRYREVPPEDFTLSVEEILARDDRQLNMIAPMNCYAAYLDKASNERDRRRIENRRRRGFREIGSERGSRRYGDVAKTAILDESISEKEGMEIAERLKKRLEEEMKDDVEGTQDRPGFKKPRSTEMGQGRPVFKKPRTEFPPHRNADQRGGPDPKRHAGHQNGKFRRQ